MSHPFQFRGQHLKLHPNRVVFWEEQKALIVADLHLGKARFFSANGIPVPANAGSQNLHNLESVLSLYNPRRVFILGDLFHSTLNADWALLEEMIERHGHREWLLIRGNHDTFSLSFYQRAGLAVIDELTLEPFLFSHELPQLVPPSLYSISGHVHPCVLLRGRGKQRLRLPCFYFGKNHALLPAFGIFTGGHLIQAASGDTLFGIGETEIWKLQGV